MMKNGILFAAMLFIAVGTSVVVATQQDFGVTRHLYVGGNSTIAGNEEVKGNRSVVGTSTLTGSTAVTGNFGVGGDLAVTGAISTTTTVSTGPLKVTGKVTTLGTAPTVTNGTIDTKSTNFAGRVSVGTTSTLITFSPAFTAVPSCVVSGSDVAVLFTPTTSTLTITAAGTIAEAHYHCIEME